MFGRSQPMRIVLPGAPRRLRLQVGFQLELSQSWPERPRQMARTVAARPQPDLSRLPPQPTLVLPRRVVGMTGLMTLLESVLAKLSIGAQPIPNNVILGERIGGHVRSSIDRAIKRLARCGAIRTEHTLTHRRIWVSSTGCATGWGEYRQGHAPYSTNSRSEIAANAGTPPKPEIIRLRAPAIIFAIEIGKADGCQWIVERLGRLNTLYCGAEVTGRRSYCPVHYSEVYPNARSTGVGQKASSRCIA